MKTCMNITAESWPTMKSPKAIGTRHRRYSPGYVFNRAQFTATAGHKPEVNMNGPGVSR
jgi:hypothetical protein